MYSVLYVTQTYKLCSYVLQYLIRHYKTHGLIARNVDRCGGDRNADADATKKKRAIVEGIVGLLLAQSKKSLVWMAFLSGILKTAIAVSTSNICTSAELTRRTGSACSWTTPS